jgi:hypothetical protein
MRYEATGRGPTIAAAEADARHKIQQKITEDKDHEFAVGAVMAGAKAAPTVLGYLARAFAYLSRLIFCLMVKPIPTLLHAATCYAIMAAVHLAIIGIIYVFPGLALENNWGLLFIGLPYLAIMLGLIASFLDGVEFWEASELRLYRLLPAPARAVVMAISCLVPIVMLFGIAHFFAGMFGYDTSSVTRVLASVPQVVEQSPIFFAIVGIIWLFIFIAALRRRSQIWQSISEASPD